MKKEAWIKKSLKILSQKGHTAVKIDTLCKELRLTKGSFYHHFKNREDLSKEIILYWKKLHYKDSELKDLKNLNHKNLLKHAQDIFKKNEDKLERSIRFWSFYDLKVKKLLNSLDKERVDYISAILIQLGLNPKKANKLAQFHFAAHTGAVMLDGNNSMVTSDVSKILLANIKSLKV